MGKMVDGGDGLGWVVEDVGGSADVVVEVEPGG